MEKSHVVLTIEDYDNMQKQIGLVESILNCFVVEKSWNGRLDTALLLTANDVGSTHILNRIKDQLANHAEGDDYTFRDITSVTLYLLEKVEPAIMPDASTHEEE